MKLVLATSNKGKLAEIAPILQAFGFDALPQNQFGFMDAEETGLTFVENALIKARHACRQTGLPALATSSLTRATAAGVMLMAGILTRMFTAIFLVCQCGGPQSPPR